jgi:hypothetical protein
MENIEDKLRALGARVNINVKENGMDKGHGSCCHVLLEA